MSPAKPAAPPETVAAMLRDGASYRQIHQTLGSSHSTIAKIRRNLGIPTAGQKKDSRTIAEAITLNTETGPDGHTHWTGPTAGSNLELWAQGHRYNGRHEIFKAHHGRDPVGYVLTTCTQPGCIAGAHLADRTIRQARQRAEQQAEQQLDELYSAIFGTASA